MRKIVFSSILLALTSSCTISVELPNSTEDSPATIESVPTLSNPKSSNQLPKGSWYTVEEIVDGDTFRIRKNGKKVRVRLIGIDAPETRDSQHKKIGFYGQEAKAYLAQRIAGQTVLLVKDVDSLDRYGRTLSYVYLENGSFINLEMVENGYAKINTVPPNVTHAETLKKAQRKARGQNKGLWQKN